MVLALNGFLNSFARNGVLTSIVAISGLFVLSLAFIWGIKKITRLTTDKLLSPQLQEIYQITIEPIESVLILLIPLCLFDLELRFLAQSFWLNLLEIPLSVGIAVAIIAIGYKLFSRFFDNYLLQATLASEQKLNSELLLLTKFGANAGITILTVFVFAQVHDINLFGLLASLGIGGLAVAFAAQKTLEQLLGGIVLYLDRPFTISDYIGLSDGTFGRVESIGLRSTKIRTSGKGTLTIVPNSSLTQINIENFTGAKKIVSLINLTFHRAIPDDEKALIRQVILESTKDIFGIDSRSTEVVFKDTDRENSITITQCQINFFILGSEDISMDLRRQLLDVARQNIANTLKEYGISFDIENKNINVESPITI